MIFIFRFIFSMIMNTECVEPLGLESDKIQDSQITASDEHTPNFAWRATGARLNHNTAWSTHTLDGNQWIQIQLNQQQYITGVMTQGKNREYVKNYKVLYSEDENTWEYVTDTIGGAAKVCLQSKSLTL